jgi:5'(3')-deoxyribonucleotidase
MLGMSVFAQQVIKANTAINHIGEEVIVADTVYNIKAYNDSTAVIDLGGKNLKAPINVILNFNSKVKLEPKFFKSLKDARIAVTGFVVLVDDAPAIILTKKDQLRVLSNGVNRRWLSFSVVSHKNILVMK